MSNETIKVGDNGVIFNLPIKSKGIKVPIIGAEITVNFITGKREFSKEASVIDGANGICQVTLAREDLATPGNYFFEAIVKMQNGNEFTSDKLKFEVESRLKKSP